MKKILFLMAALMTLIMSSCVPKFSTAFYYTDYSQYMDKGFFITESNTVPFDYNPVGSLFLRQKAGEMAEMEIIPQDVEDSKNYDDIYGPAKKGSRKINNIVRPTENSALDAAYDFAKSKGADGILNISFDYYLEGSRQVVVLKGMLIKRK